jgi:hypothetical protein
MQSMAVNRKNVDAHGGAAPVVWTRMAKPSPHSERDAKSPHTNSLAMPDSSTSPHVAARQRAALWQVVDAFGYASTASDRINDAFNNVGTPVGMTTRKAMLALIGPENVSTKALEFAGKQTGSPEPKNGVTPASRCVSSLMAAVYSTIPRPKRDRCTSALCAELDAKNDALVAGLESDAVATLATLQYVKEMYEFVHGRRLTDLEVAQARLLI